MTEQINNINEKENTDEKFYDRYINSINFVDENGNLPSPPLIGERFLEKIVKDYFPYDTEDIDYTDGTGDGGCDGTNIRKEDDANILDFFQGKAGKGNKMSEVEKDLQKFMKSIREENNLSSLASNTYNLINGFFENMTDKNVFIWNFFSYDRLTDQNMAEIERLEKRYKKELEDKYNKKINFFINMVCINDIYHILIEEGKIIKTNSSLKFKGGYLLDHKFYRKYTCGVDSIEYYKFLNSSKYEENYKYLLRTNMRGNVKRSKINPKIRKSLEDNESDYFDAANHGVTILCDHFDIDENGKIIKIQNITFPDGGQTTNVIYSTVGDKLKYNIPIEKTVNITIIEISFNLNIEKRKKLIKIITEGRNKKNPINEKDFSSIDPRIDELQRLLKHEEKLWIETKSGFFDSISKQDKEGLININRNIQPSFSDIFRYYYAFEYGECGKVKKVTDEFSTPNKEEYENILKIEKYELMRIIKSMYLLESSILKLLKDKHGNKSSRWLYATIFHELIISLISSNIERERMYEFITRLHDMQNKNIFEILLERVHNIFIEYIKKEGDFVIYKEKYYKPEYSVTSFIGLSIFNKENCKNLMTQIKMEETIMKRTEKDIINKLKSMLCIT